LDQEADELQIKDFEIMPGLGVSFEIVTGAISIPSIGCLA
jgi:hypothetical protein